MTPQLADLLEFLRFPSVSTRPEHTPDLAACAEWLKKKFTAIGLDAQVLPTGGHPAVVARSPRDPAKRTVLIYGHYDVQPVEPLDEWTSPPFEPVIQNDRIIARGATDNKGQILAHILGVGEALKAGPLPVNVVFLVEGEEETGSPNLAALLRNHRDDLACDVIVISDTGMVAHGWPTLAYSLRGIAALEFKVFGPLHDLHSGVFGGAVMNPLTAAARLIASLHDPRGRVAIEGFYDDVRPMFDWERDAAAALPLTDLVLQDLTGVRELFGEPGYSGVERIGARPTAEVNGFGGGYQGVGTKTVLPKEAFVKLSFRLVPHQKPDTIMRLAESHLRRHCPPGVEIEIERGHGGLPYYVDPNSPDGTAARRALARVFGRETALMREGGSIPIVADFKEILGADTLLAGLASPDCRAHSPNENFPVENFTRGIALTPILLNDLA
jgi:acetylornithine deacetylase/succinyl-diaminopimelate desuccinylase-like protein